MGYYASLTHVHMYSPTQYVCGSVMIFVFLNALEGVIMSLLSKLVSPELARGTWNSGLLATGMIYPPSHTPLLAHYLAPLLSPPITPIHTPLLTPPVTIFHTHPLLHTLSYTPLTHTLIPPPIHTSTLSHTHFHPLSHNRGRHIGPRAR